MTSTGRGWSRSSAARTSMCRKPLCSNVFRMRIDSWKSGTSRGKLVLTL